MNHVLLYHCKHMKGDKVEALLIVAVIYTGIQSVRLVTQAPMGEHTNA